MQKSQTAKTDNVLSEIDRTSIIPEKIEVVKFAPPAELTSYVSQIHFFRCEDPYIRDRQPAALSHLLFILQGESQLQFHDGHTDKLHPVSVLGPGTAAAEFAFTGPFHNLGFALTPLGFVALTGQSASRYADRAVAANELFGPEIDLLAERLLEASDMDGFRIAPIIEAICAFLLPRVRSVPTQHIALIQTVTEWLSRELDPDVGQLYDSLPVSRSTAVRLITRYFGSAPKPLMRKYRAVRAATLLCDPACTPELRAQIESLFYDQPHMIREIRHFAGRTPGALDGDDCKILRLWLSKDSYRDVATYPG